MSCSKRFHFISSHFSTGQIMEYMSMESSLQARIKIAQLSGLLMWCKQMSGNLYPLEFEEFEEVYYFNTLQTALISSFNSVPDHRFFFALNSVSLLSGVCDDTLCSEFDGIWALRSNEKCAAVASFDLFCGNDSCHNVRN